MSLLLSYFVVETGEGLSDANSYISVEEFKELSDLFGYDYSDIADNRIQSFLIRATIILDSEYRSDFPGNRKVSGQALEWPRDEAVYIDGESIDDDIVPKEIKYAMVELLYILNAGGNVQPTISTSGTLSHERKRVEGAVEIEQRYRSDYNYRRDVYTVVTDALSRITGGLSAYSNLRIIRVGG
jgi:hypothetical protein